MRIYREEYIDKMVTRTMEMRIPHAMTDPTFRALVREVKTAARETETQSK